MEKSLSMTIVVIICISDVLSTGKILLLVEPGGALGT